MGWGMWRQGLCHAVPRHLGPAWPRNPLASPRPCQGQRGMATATTTVTAATPAHPRLPRHTMSVPVFVGAHPRALPCAPRGPHGSRVPGSPIFCVKILSNVTSPRSSRYFCMTLRMLGRQWRASPPRLPRAPWQRSAPDTPLPPMPALYPPYPFSPAPPVSPCYLKPRWHTRLPTLCVARPQV